MKKLQNLKVKPTIDMKSGSLTRVLSPPPPPSACTRPQARGIGLNSCGVLECARYEGCGIDYVLICAFVQVEKRGGAAKINCPAEKPIIFIDPYFLPEWFSNRGKMH